MTDFTRLMDPPPPADWTEAGIFRAAYLALFDEEDRAVLRRAGKVLAIQAISGDVADEPAVVAHLEAAYRDARMLSTYLREIHQKAEDHPLTERAERLAAMAKVWSAEAAATALTIRRALDGDGSGAT